MCTHIYIYGHLYACVYVCKTTQEKQMTAEAERNPPEIIHSDTLAQHSHPLQVTQGHVQSGLE